MPGFSYPGGFYPGGEVPLLSGGVAHIELNRATSRAEAFLTISFPSLAPHGIHWPSHTKVKADRSSMTVKAHLTSVNVKAHRTKSKLFDYG